MHLSTVPLPSSIQKFFESPSFCPLSLPPIYPLSSSDSNSPRLLDEKEQSVQQQERQRLFREYRAERQTVLQRREADRETRNQAKVTQLELAEQWQVSTVQQSNLDVISSRVSYRSLVFFNALHSVLRIIMLE